MTALPDTLGQVPDILARVPAGAAYALVGAAVLAESVLLIGAFVPTLTVLLTAGALARTPLLDLPLVIAAAASAVVAGDFLAHRTGGLLGRRLRTGRLGCRIPAAAWQRAEALMLRYGGRAVFLSRFLPVLRTLTPHLTGATRLPYRRIAPYSVTAAVTWSTAESALGYAAAASLRHTLTLGPALAAVAGAVALAGAVAAAGAGASRAWAERRRGRASAGRDHRGEPGPTAVPCEEAGSALGTGL